MLYLSETFADLWQGADPFEQAMGLTGELFRDLESRKTMRIEAGGRAYFAKLHYGVGWGEIVKNLVQLRLPTLSAETEWRAIGRLHALGVPTMTVAAFGKRGTSPARMRSFIVTEALEGVESLEELTTAPERFALTPRERFALIGRIAEISRTLHDNGVNHRDYYLCHLLLERDSMGAADTGPTLYVIDLHRAQMRKRTPQRWRVKDIGGLFFSAIGPDLARRDLLRFMKRYTGKSLRQTLAEDRAFWRSVYRRGCRMYRANGDEVPAWLAALV